MRLSGISPDCVERKTPVIASYLRRGRGSKPIPELTMASLGGTYLHRD